MTGWHSLWTRLMPCWFTNVRLLSNRTQIFALKWFSFFNFVFFFFKFCVQIDVARCSIAKQMIALHFIMASVSLTFNLNCSNSFQQIDSNCFRFKIKYQFRTMNGRLSTYLTFGTFTIGTPIVFDLCENTMRSMFKWIHLQLIWVSN